MSLQARDELSLVECRRHLSESRPIFLELQKREKELAAVAEVKSKFQDICRLLRKQNKDIIEENDRLVECEKLLIP